MSDMHHKTIHDPSKNNKYHQTYQRQLNNRYSVLVCCIFITDHIKEKNNLADDKSEHEEHVEVVCERTFGWGIKTCVDQVNAVENHEKHELDRYFA